MISVFIRNGYKSADISNNKQRQKQDLENHSRLPFIELSAGTGQSKQDRARPWTGYKHN